MPAFPVLPFAVVLLLTFGLSAALVAAAIRYATGRGLLDQPGRRRSHELPTPRGGGIGIVVALLSGLKLLALAGGIAGSDALAIALALLAVAGVGWLDDHRPLPAMPRLLVHACAAAVVTLALFPWPGAMGEWVALVAAMFALMVAINFCNFMDGSNGLVTLQVLAASAVMMIAALGAAHWSTAAVSALLLAAAAGFLPFNFPAARIFLGDVGSGALGLALGAAALLCWRDGSLAVPALLVLTSALWLDAGLTLALRILAGRRWMQAHRSHLYQWLIRRGRSHASVGLAYLGWTVLVAGPLALWSNAEPTRELPALVAVAVAGSVLWLGLRRRLRREAGTYSSSLSR